MEFQKVTAILDLLQLKGSGIYGGESVPQLQHALQCASLAEQAGAPALLITACLLRDDQAKVVGKRTPALEHFQGILFQSRK